MSMRCRKNSKEEEPKTYLVRFISLGTEVDTEIVVLKCWMCFSNTCDKQIIGIGKDKMQIMNNFIHKPLKCA